MKVILHDLVYFMNVIGVVRPSRRFPMLILVANVAIS